MSAISAQTAKEALFIAAQQIPIADGISKTASGRRRMTSLAVGSVLLGIVFGRFFKVWVLVPASALTFLSVFASSAFYEYTLSETLIEFTMISACLQTGYAFAAFQALSESGSGAPRYRVNRRIRRRRL